MKKKLLAIVTFPCLLTACTAAGTTDDLYLIPENYEGYVYAFYNVHGAPALKKEGKYDVHQSDEKGHFVTSAPEMDTGLVTDSYYYFDHDGSRTKIDENCIRGIGTGSFAFEAANGQQIEIPYTGIEVTKDACSPDFPLSANGINPEDFDSAAAIIAETYYGAELIGSE